MNLWPLAPEASALSAELQAHPCSEVAATLPYRCGPCQGDRRCARCPVAGDRALASIPSLLEPRPSIKWARIVTLPQASFEYPAGQNREPSDQIVSEPCAWVGCRVVVILLFFHEKRSLLPYVARSSSATVESRHVAPLSCQPHSEVPVPYPVSCAHLRR